MRGGFSPALITMWHTGIQWNVSMVLLNATFSIAPRHLQASLSYKSTLTLDISCMWLFIGGEGYSYDRCSWKHKLSTKRHNHGFISNNTDALCIWALWSNSGSKLWTLASNSALRLIYLTHWSPLWIGSYLCNFPINFTVIMKYLCYIFWKAFSDI